MVADPAAYAEDGEDDKEGEDLTDYARVLVSRSVAMGEEKGAKLPDRRGLRFGGATPRHSCDVEGRGAFRVVGVGRVEESAVSPGLEFKPIEII